MAAAAFAAPSNPSDANIGGHVIEAENGEHLPYCLVKIIGTNLATLTDASGHYVFRDLKPGEYTLEASFTGYKTQTRKVNLSAKQTLEVNFEISPDAFMLDQVVVTSSKSEVARRESFSCQRGDGEDIHQRRSRVACRRPRLPARRTRRERLPELRFHAGAHQWS